jgi:small subunit ribosomal protein S1
MNINSDERRIGLSIKQLDIEDDKKLLGEYIDKTGSSTSAFGDILRENLQNELNKH